MADSVELLGALHHSLQDDGVPDDMRAWRDAFAAIRAAVEADPSTDRFDRETLDVIERKLGDLIDAFEKGDPEPDFKPARTWVAALGAAIWRRREAARRTTKPN